MWLINHNWLLQKMNMPEKSRCKMLIVTIKNVIKNLWILLKIAYVKQSNKKWKCQKQLKMKIATSRFHFLVPISKIVFNYNRLSITWRIKVQQLNKPNYTINIAVYIDSTWRTLQVVTHSTQPSFEWCAQA